MVAPRCTQLRVLRDGRGVRVGVRGRRRPHFCLIVAAALQCARSFAQARHAEDPGPATHPVVNASILEEAIVGLVDVKASLRIRVLWPSRFVLAQARLSAPAGGAAAGAAAGGPKPGATPRSPARDPDAAGLAAVAALASSLAAAQLRRTKSAQADPTHHADVRAARVDVTYDALVQCSLQQGACLHSDAGNGGAEHEGAAGLDWLLVARTLDAIKAAALLGLGRWAEIEHHGPDGDPRHGSVPTHEIARLHLHVLPAGAKASVRSHHCTFVCARV